MTAEWMPVNPCGGCKIFEGVNEICQPRDGAHCSAFREYVSNLSTLDTVLKYLNKWIEDNSKFEIGSKFDSMLKELKGE